VPESRIPNLSRAGLRPDGQADRERDAERQLQPPRLAERTSASYACAIVLSYVNS
jgi:hypothetical protein